jgi:hypothetical protein
MPMIDVYAAAGTFSDRHQLAQDLAAVVGESNYLPVTQSSPSGHGSC